MQRSVPKFLETPLQTLRRWYIHTIWSFRAAKRLKRRFYTADGEPLRCPCCYSNRIMENITELVEDGHRVAEVELYCERCTSLVGFWGYGYYDPEFMGMSTRSMKKHKVVLGDQDKGKEKEECREAL